METLFQKVREACNPSTWSRGVEFARTGVVVGDQADDDEVIVRITTRQGMICPEVKLYLDDSEWECDCRGKFDPCEHVAGAVIALRQARQSGKSLPGEGRSPQKITYRFLRKEGRLWLERGVFDGDRFELLEATLDAVASGRVQGPEFLATRADLAAEVAFGTRRRGVLERAAIPRVFKALAHCDDIRIDDLQVQVSTAVIRPVVVLEDRGEGFVLFTADNPQVTETFEGGLVLCGDTLHPEGSLPLTGRENEEFGKGRLYPWGQVTELVAEVLPALRGRFEVQVRTDRLPDTVVEKPRLLVSTARDGDRLEAVVKIVYGDPVRAEIKDHRLVPVAGKLPLRDRQEEERLIERSRKVFGLIPGHGESFDPVQAVAFTSRLQRWKGQVEGEGHQQFFPAPALTPRLEMSGDRFDVQFEPAGSTGGQGGGRSGADAQAVVGAWRSGASMVELDGGGWAPLPEDWLSRFGAQIADLLAARNEDGKLAPCAVPDLARLCHDLDEPAPPGFEKLQALLGDFEGIPAVDPGPGLAGVLRSYQQTGVNWLAFLREAGLGAMLADDMGLGKTLQALCAVRGRTLVVGPTSVVHNWADEAKKFRPDLSVCVYHGAARELAADADLTLTSYALLRRDKDTLHGERWDTVVLDEAQAIKNPQSQVAQAAFELQAGFRITMSGTPVENRLEDLWSQFHFINRGLLGGLQEFTERYVRPISDGDVEVAERLQERIRPFLLRRLKREVAPELPPRTDMVLHCGLSTEERELYDAIRASTLEEVVKKLQQGGSVIAALEALLRLRQAACHPALVPGQTAGSSSKTRLLADTLATVQADGHKALVFSQWTSMLDLIEPHLDENGISFTRLDGSTRDRAGVVRSFQSDGGPTVLLISLKAGGTGLNLTAADHVFLMDPWWNPAVEDQAADRAHRIGQDRPVMVYHVVAEDTVEEKILALQEKKREIAAVATGAAKAGGALTRDDLLALLG
jgi:superfamily II DNA or RNA helicase